MKDLDSVQRFWHAHLRQDAPIAPGEEAFIQLLADASRSAERALEIGIGRGRMAALLQSYCSGLNIFGIDITDNISKSGVPGVKGDVRSLPFQSHSFDLVYSLGVVEHFPETARAVKEHARVTTNGGHVLITTPHACAFTVARYLSYLLRHRRHGTFEEIRGRNLTLTEMCGHFRAAGLAIERRGVYGLYGISRKLGALRLDHLRNRLERNPFFGSFLYVYGRKP